MRLFIYTMPKAGTYLLAEFMEKLGFTNTGFHVEQNEYLDTKMFTLAENAVTPSMATKPRTYLATLRSLADNELAFGHLPAPILCHLIANYKFICAYRNPRKTLVSEFIDFRFRRQDIDWISKNAISDDHEAFVEYLVRHGPIHMTIFSQILATKTLYSDPLFKRFNPKRVVFTNFQDFLRDDDEAIQIAAEFNVDAETAVHARAAALATETKTKATDLDIDRNSFWTPAAEEAAKGISLNAYIRRAKSLGLKM